MGRLFREAPVENSEYLPFINTGSPLDMFNGKFVEGFDGKYYLYGGMSSTSAVMAGPQKFKSGFLLSSCVNAVARMPDSDCTIFDSEYSHEDKERIWNMSSMYLDDPVERAKHIKTISESVKVINPTHDKSKDLNTFIEYAMWIAEQKCTKRKDWEIETPFIDEKTGKRQRMLLPTIMGVDSWSEAKPRHIEQRTSEWGEGTQNKEKRTIFMDEGWHKKVLLSELPKIASKGGIYFFISSHIANKVGMDGKPMKKDLQYMKQDEVAVGVGRQFYYLMSTLIQINNASVLTSPNDSSKCEFPLGAMTGPTELSRLDTVLVRSKNNNSGNKMPFISSQKHGILRNLTNYDYLRTNQYFGMGTSGKPATVFQPNIPLPKTQVFQKSLDYKTDRALEILSQLLFVQKNWSIRDSEINYGISPLELFTALSKTTYAIDDILNSRSWWTYVDHPRPYLALPDIIRIADGSYKPKSLSMGALGKK